MRPVLFTVGRWRVRSYPALLYVGLVVGVLIGNVQANLRGLAGIRVYVATLLLLVPALAGARLAYVLGHWDRFRDDPSLMVRSAVGGQAMYGGLVAVPLSVPLLAGLDLPFWAFWDVATFTMLSGMVLTRIGCLLNGCCSGRTTVGRFGLVLPDVGGVGELRIPTQLLEAGMGGLVLAAVWLVPAGAPPGTVFLWAVVGYSIGRLLLQGTRQRDTRVGGVSAQRVASVALAALALVLWVSVSIT